jgi:hypothetical protein
MAPPWSPAFLFVLCVRVLAFGFNPAHSIPLSARHTILAEYESALGVILRAPFATKNLSSVWDSPTKCQSKRDPSLALRMTAKNGLAKGLNA